MGRYRFATVLVAALAAWSLASPCPAALTTLLSENFDGITLGRNQWEPNGSGPYFGVEPNAYTHTPPPGWTNDQSWLANSIADPAVGVPEWEGWSFTKKAWWAAVSGDQGRGSFTKGVGNVAVVDPDEWDDQGDPEHVYGLFYAYLHTPAVSLTGAAPGSAVLQFDSSWSPEDTQRARVDVSYDGGATYGNLLYWDSPEASPFYKAKALDETVLVPLTVPDGATSAIFKFGMEEAGDDWWWAIDNVKVSHSGGTVLNQDFEGLALGQPVWEPNGTAGNPTIIENAIAHTPPAGWSIDNSQLPTGGVPEWAGWSFTNPSFWAQVAGDQRRTEFTKGTTVIAVADGDEWDDTGHAAGAYNTFLKSKAISLAGVEAGSVKLTFDSSWRPEVVEYANITVSYDGGAPIEVLRWEADVSVEGRPNYDPNSPYFKGDNSTNDTIVVNLNNPAGAQSMVVTFGYGNAFNNWWWAVDNIVIEGNKSALHAGDANGDGKVDDLDASILAANWQRTGGASWAQADFNADGNVNDLDASILAANWQYGVGGAVPEPGTLALLLTAGLALLAWRRRG